MKINKLLYTCILLLSSAIFISCDDDKEVNDFTVDKETMEILIGDRSVITANGIPSNDVESSTFEWSSADESIATVTEWGVVQGIEEGETNITVKFGSESKTIHVVVKDPIVLPGEVGSWRFDDPSNILKATSGKDLQIGANKGTPSLSDFPSVNGPAGQGGNKAIQVEKGFFLKMEHDIKPKEGEGVVTEYTILIDFKVPALDGWRSFIQTNPENKDDADVFMKTEGQIGVGSTGYTVSPVVKAGQWQRLILSYKLGGDGWIKYYLDGQPILAKTDDERFAMASILLLFADNDGEDAVMDVSEVMIWDKALDDNQMKKANRVVGKDRY